MMPLLDLLPHIQALDQNWVGSYFSMLLDHRHKQSLFNWMLKKRLGRHNNPVYFGQNLLWWPETFFQHPPKV